MKRIHLLVSAGLVVGLGTPIAVILAATFGGPPNCSTPPCNNVPGVIWNVAGTASNQPGAQVDFGTPTPGVPFSTIKSDLGLTSSKAIRIDVNGNATLNMGNWGGPIAPYSKPMTFNVYGGARAIGITANPVLGEDGRMQADKFCFNPGNPADCITTWSGGAGSYVLKAGDSMTGTLQINSAAQFGLQATGTLSTGVNAYGQQYGGYFKSSLGPANATGMYGYGIIGGEMLGEKIGANIRTTDLVPGGYGLKVTGNQGIIVSPQGVNSIGLQVGSPTRFATAAIFNGVSQGISSNINDNSVGTRAGLFTGGQAAVEANGYHAGGIFTSSEPVNGLGISATADGVAGFFQSTNNIGVNAFGNIKGVYGSGVIGVQGVGGQNAGYFIDPAQKYVALLGSTQFGAAVYAWATSTGGNGTWSIGDALGVYGEAKGGTGAGVYGKGYQGVVGMGSNPANYGIIGASGYGGIFSGSIAGVYAVTTNNVTNAVDGRALGLATNGGHFEGANGVDASGTNYGAHFRSMGHGARIESHGSGAQSHDGLQVFNYAPAPGGISQTGIVADMQGAAAGGSSIAGDFRGRQIGVRATNYGSVGVGFVSYNVDNGVFAEGQVNGITAYQTAAGDGSASGAVANAGIYARGTTYGGYFDSTGAGSFGIRSQTPQYLKQYTNFVSSDATDWYQLDTNNNGDFEIIPYVNGVQGWGQRIWIQGTTGNLNVIGGTAYKPGGGSWAVPSDARLKTLTGDFTRGLSDLAKIEPVTYHYKENNVKGFASDKNYIGVVAQNVQTAIPEAVSLDDDGYLVVNNDPILWTMVNSIKELKAENDELRARVEALETK